MPRILIVGSFSGRNFGDSAILAATLQELDGCLGPRTRYLVPTSNPAFLAGHFHHPRLTPVDVDTRRTKSYRFMGLPVLRALRDTDAVVTTAGIFFDHRLLDPRFNFVLSLWPILRIARASGTRIVGLNVGISGPTSRVGAHVLGRVIAAHDYLSTRDRRSHELARRWLPAERISSGADSVHLLLKGSPPVAAGAVLGVNATAYLSRFDRESRPIARADFVEALARRLDRIGMEHDLAIRLIATTPHDHALHLEVSAAMTRGAELSEIHSGTVPAGLSAFDGLAYFIGARLHACLVATALGIPTLAVRYHDKVADYMAELGLSRWVLPVEACTTDELDRRFRELTGEADAVRSRLRIAGDRRSADAGGAFARLAEMVSSRSGPT